MGKNSKKKDRINVVYSTNPDFDYDYEGEEFETLPASEQKLEAHFEKKGRGGKTAVVIKGFIGTEEDLKDLAKQLKNKLGTGGSVKDGEIIIQGNLRDKAMDILSDLAYKVKRVGG
jgi:translation initiation factor 1